MEILIISPADSARATQFQQFIKDQGHQGARLAMGQRVPLARACWLGAVLFESEQASLAAQHEAMRYLGIPLVVVAAEASASPGKTHAAFAPLVCSLDTPDAVILERLSASCEARPLDDELRRQLAEPLITAVKQTLKQLAQAEVDVRSIYERKRPMALGDLSVALTLSHPFDGLLLLSFSKPTAEALWRRILPEPAEAVDLALVADCVGEIANIVAGQAKALFAGTQYHFLFSTPRISFGHEGMKLDEYMKSIVIAFDSDAGVFALQLCQA
jgi:chemotaxis protein CheX